MRIRKRLHSLVTPPDLSSPPPPSVAAAAAAAVLLPVAAGTGEEGGKQGGIMAAAGGGGGLSGSRGGSGGVGAGGGGGRGLHPNRDPPAQTFHGCTTKPTSRPPFHPPPPGAAASEGGERSDLAPPGARFISGDVPFDHSRGEEVPKRERDGENGGDGDARRRKPGTVAPSGATVAAPKSLGAEAPEPSPGRPGYKSSALPHGVVAASARAEDMARWSDEERGFPLKKRRGCCRARGTSWFGGGTDEEEEAEEEEEEPKMVVEREMKPRSINARRRGIAASSTTTTAATGSVTAQTSVGTGSIVGAATAAGGGATKKCDDEVVKEEGGDVISAAAAILVDVNRGVGNGKKRRSPAVLMEGSRCSRVNGRGWRCCQQTLVGYSLCEHHLGKGRLRSMSSVRCNGQAKKKEEALDGAAAPSQPPSPLQQRQQQLVPSGNVGDYEEEENPSRRGRKKIGMVKARSISSLLDLPDYPTPTAMTPAPEPCPSPSPAPATGAAAAAAAAPLHDSDRSV